MPGGGKLGRTDSDEGAGLTLLAVCFAVVLFPLAITGSSVALPAINADFQNSPASGQRVVNGYNLTCAAFMAATGSPADLFGRRRMLRIGVALFVLGSLVSAAAPGILLLDLARVVAGIGAAAANALNQGDLARAAAVPEGQREAFTQDAGQAFAEGLHGLLWTMAALCAVTFVVIGPLLRERRSTPAPTAVTARR